ncbi:MAG: PAS domain-containing protein [Verrucomicrobiales bacterium]|nr:PAS domain-containing protein [Verrucomicrobiales bacterium]
MPSTTPTGPSSPDPAALPGGGAATGGPSSLSLRPPAGHTDDAEFRALYESAKEMIVILELDGRLTFVNRAFRSTLGFDDGDLDGLSLFDLVHPYDHAACQAWLHQTGRGAAGYRVRILLVARDGRHVPVESSAAPSLEGDDARRLQAIFTDLSEQERAASAQRQSGDLLQLLSHNAPCGVFITDAAGRLRYTNRRWRALADLVHVNDPRGVWWQMVHPSERDRVLSQWQSAQHGGHEFSSEFKVNLPSAEPRYVRTRLANSWSPDGRVEFCVGITEDITLQRQADEVLRQAQENLEDLVRNRTDELQQANRELADLVYAVTHDLKAPLRGIARLADWLAEDHATRLGDDGRALVGKLQGRVRKLHSLIDGILAYSRVGKGSDPDSLVDVGQLLTELVRLLDPPPTVTFRIPDTLPAITAVPHQLHQLFLNLFDNAIKFMDKPDGRIQVTCRRSGSAWEFSVSDNGPGIPARFHEKIFGLFQRLELLPDRPGTGVGLALVKRIVERRGGEIQVASEEGVGTTFRFTWPDQARGNNAS